MSSDIWAEYEQIAIKQGLISVGEEDKKKSPKRYDSLSEDAIRLLYNIEPESIYKNKSMIENAHPETCVIAPAYDAMNGVIENVQQRQNIMSYIALKTPDGKLTQKRYVKAKSDLINSLVRSGFMMDNRNEADLMVLADYCSNRLAENEKPITKNATPAVGLAAAGPWGWAALGIAAVTALTYYLGYAQTAAINIASNCEIVLNELNYVMDKPYAKSIQLAVWNLENAAKKSVQASGQVTELKNNEPKTKADLTAAITKIDNTIKAIDEHQKLAQDVAMQIPEWIQDIKVTAQNEQGIESDFYAKMKGLLGRFTWDNAETLTDNLKGLQQAITDDAKNTTPNKQRAENLKQKLEEKLKTAPEEIIPKQEEQKPADKKEPYKSKFNYTPKKPQPSII